MQIWLDYVHFAEMPATSTIGTHTHLRVVVIEVDIHQFRSSLTEILVVDNALRFFGEGGNHSRVWPLYMYINLFREHLMVILHALALHKGLRLVHRLVVHVFEVQHGVIEGAVLLLVERGFCGGQGLPSERHMALVWVHEGAFGEGGLVAGSEKRGSSVSP